MTRQSVCIFCASSDCTAQTYRNAAIEVTRQCVKAGLTIVYGAGSVGLMGDVADTCINEGGKVVGVIPQFMIDRGWNRTGLTKTIITADMGQRKAEMRRISDAIIALPGGCGTFEELLEAITQRQLGLYTHPIILLNTDGFYNNLIAQLEKALDERFMRPEHANLWNIASTPEEAVTLLLTLPDIKSSKEKRMLK